MTGEGTVVKICGENAIVRIERKSACSGDCSSCGLCENPVFEIEVSNSVKASVGDAVRLYMPTSKVYLTAFLVYMLPLIAIFAIMGAGLVLTIPTAVKVALYTVAIGGWIGLVAGYNKRANLRSEIVEIIK